MIRRGSALTTEQEWLLKDLREAEAEVRRLRRRLARLSRVLASHAGRAGATLAAARAAAGKAKGGTARARLRAAQALLRALRAGGARRHHVRAFYCGPVQGGWSLKPTAKLRGEDRRLVAALSDGRKPAGGGFHGAYHGTERFLFLAKKGGAR
jgi:hypothetical protein